MAAYVDMESAQFENVNALRKFPFACDASLVDREGRELPSDAIVDLHMFVPADFPNLQQMPAEALPSVRMTSFHLSEAMVSACFVSESGGKTSAASVTVAAGGFLPYFPYRLEPLAGTQDMGGVVSFGDVFSKFSGMDIRGLPETYFFDDARIHPCQVICAKPAGLRSFVDPRTGEKVSGDVDIEFTGYVEATRDGNSVSLELGSGGDVELASECAKATGADVCGATPIVSINGIRPNAYGNIVLWFH